MKIRTSNRVDWLDDFAASVATAAPVETAVSTSRQRQSSILDDIRSIVSKAPVYSSVQDKVQDIQRKMGLDEFLKRKALVEELNAMKSTAMNEELKNAVEAFVKNKVMTHHGFISVPALQQAVLETFKGKGLAVEDVENSDFERFLFDQIQEVKSTHRQHEDWQNMGKDVGSTPALESSNTDFFAGLNPAKF